MTQKKTPSGWDELANWYNGWVGKGGSDHHRKSAIPALLNLLPEPDTTSQLLDVGCGSGVLAPFVTQHGWRYTGVDVSKRLLKIAAQNHRKHGQFHRADARKLAQQIGKQRFDAVSFLLSIQDMNPLEAVIGSAAAVVREGGAVIIVMTHPCFRIPRQSGWGYDAGRKLQYRRVDRYLTPLDVPMKQHGRGTTISFHRPLSAYINALGACGLRVERMDEITTHERGRNKAERRAFADVPLFLALRAIKA